jgi:uncharacterized membrane protein YcfT
MWFIYLLPIFLVTAKLVRRVPPVMVLGVMALLQTVHVETGWTLVDEFGFRGVFFFTGWYFAPRIFAFAAWVRANPAWGIAGLIAWGLAEETLVQAGVSTLPGISLVLGWAGALAVMAFAAVLARKAWLNVLRYAGEQSLGVYLACYLPLDVTRTVLLKTHVIPDIGWMSVVVTVATFIGPLVLYELVKGSRLSFLFERPQAFRLEAPRRPTLQPAE